MRAWLFGLVGLTYVVDLIDSLMKGQTYFMSLGMEYLIVSLVQLSLCVAAMLTSNERYHAAFAVAMLAYQLSWAFRMFETVA